MKKLNIAVPISLTSLTTLVMSVLLPLYTFDMGMAPLAITGLYSVFSLVLMISNVMIGRFADRLGRKPIMVFGLSFYMVAYYLFWLAQNAEIIYLARLLQAVGSACVGISTFSMVTDLGGEKRALNYGILDSYTYRGGLLGIALCFFSFNTEKFSDGWDKFFMVCTSCAIVSVVYTLIRVKETKVTIVNTEKQKLNIDKAKRKIMVFIGIVCVFTGSLFAVFTLYLKEIYDASLLDIGIAFILPSVVTTIATPFLGYRSDKVGHYRSMLTGLGVTALSTITLLFMKTIFQFGAIWIIYSVADSMFSISLDAIFTKNLDDGMKGEMAGRYSRACSVGNIIGPIFGGYIFQSMGPKYVFIFSAVGIIVMTVVAVILFKSEDNQPLENEIL